MRLRNVMIFLFIAMGGVFIALIFMSEQGLVMAILNGVTRTTPIYFLIASVYFENRFEFYDLVVKRAVMILLSVFVLGVYFALVLPSLRAAAGRRGAAVAVCGGARADRDDHAVAGGARRALARSHVARPRVHAGRSRQARAGRDAAGHRRSVARRGHRSAAQRDFRRARSSCWSGP